MLLLVVFVANVVVVASCFSCSSSCCSVGCLMTILKTRYAQQFEENYRDYHDTDEGGICRVCQQRQHQ